MPSRSAAPLRRIPQQERGQNRVSTLLDAAADVISEVGYEAATMSAIAERGGACIGSLYQFFPNKQALAQALRNRHTESYGSVLASVEDDARSRSLDEFLGSLVDATVEFVDAHPAFLPLLDAPASTRTSAELRDRIRQELAHLLRLRRPRIAPGKATLIATVSLQLLKCMNVLYSDARPAERRGIVREFKTVLTCYLDARIGSAPAHPTGSRQR